MRNHVCLLEHLQAPRPRHLAAPPALGRMHGCTRSNARAGAAAHLTRARSTTRRQAAPRTQSRRRRQAVQMKARQALLPPLWAALRITSRTRSWRWGAWTTCCASPCWRPRTMCRTAPSWGYVTAAWHLEISCRGETACPVSSLETWGRVWCKWSRYHCVSRMMTNSSATGDYYDGRCRTTGCAWPSQRQLRRMARRPARAWRPAPQAKACRRRRCAVRCLARRLALPMWRESHAI